MKCGRVNQLLSPFYPLVTSRATRWQWLLGAVQGAWGAELGWIGLPKDCRCRGNGRVRPCGCVCLSTLLIPHCAAQTRFDMGISRAHLTPETTVQLGSRHTARRGVEGGGVLKPDPNNPALVWCCSTYQVSLQPRFIAFYHFRRVIKIRCTAQNFHDFVLSWTNEWLGP